MQSSAEPQVGVLIPVAIRPMWLAWRANHLSKVTLLRKFRQKSKGEYMKLSHLGFLLLGLAAVVLVSPTEVMGQSFELNPYLGYYSSSASASGTLRNEPFYGVRMGAFLDANLEFEAQFGYIEHFKAKDIDPRTRGLIWNGGFSYNFSTDEFPFTHKFAPFFVLDVGGITTRTDGYTYPVAGKIPLASGAVLDTVRTVAVNSNDTFFNVSYGVGLKSVKLWGPMGFRGEVRGRTIPNYYHGSPTWLEGSVGINFVFGALKPY
jgi:hypothetical protein